IKYDTKHDCFAADFEGIYDEATLFDCQRAFADALEQFQQGVKSKYESRIDLVASHSWDEVIEYANEARNKYVGVDRKGIMKKIDHRLKTFQTAAPAIEAWLKLLPSTSTYGSVVCGGLTLILEAAIRLRQLRKETLNALDQIPLCIENAQHLIQTYGYPQVKRQVAKLYIAILHVLQHILGWYERAAALKYLSAFWKGPAYAERLKAKMKDLQIASQDMGERGTQSGQLRLKEIRDVALYTRDQVDDLRILALEARNHLYAVFKDTELWQEALQSWKESKFARESRITSEDQAPMKEGNAAARQSLLARFGPDYNDPTRDMEVVLGQLTSMLLVDQDRVGGVIYHLEVQEWLLNPLFGAILVHGNGRRHDPISSTSVACALLVHIFSKKLPKHLRFPTLYWFCGLHNTGYGGGPLAMLRGLVCQLLCFSCCICSVTDHNGLDVQDPKKLLKLFRRLLRDSSHSGPIMCILDGLSFYEGRHQRDELGKIIRELSNLAKANPPQLFLFLTSPTRTTYVSQEPSIAQDLTVTDVPAHVDGLKQGVNIDQIMSSTASKARKLSESFESASIKDKLS
ncbi:MAG: hypothetical protein Q9224_005519, partial [Gallowayella concinna]